MRSEIKSSPNIAFFQSNLRSIREIVEAHDFKQPALVDYEDQDYGMTLMVRPKGEPSMFDIAAIMDDFKRKFDIDLLVLTPDVVEREHLELVEIEPETD